MFDDIEPDLVIDKVKPPGQLHSAGTGDSARILIRSSPTLCLWALRISYRYNRRDFLGLFIPRSRRSVCVSGGSRTGSAVTTHHQSAAIIQHPSRLFDKCIVSIALAAPPLADIKQSQIRAHGGRRCSFCTESFRRAVPPRARRGYGLSEAVRHRVGQQPLSVRSHSSTGLVVSPHALRVTMLGVPVVKRS
jgi:hypothetical protein